MTLPILESSDQIVPGDVLLYKACSFYGLGIEIKTWHPESHVEMYVGGGKSVASRDGIGTGLFDLRLDHLEKVCRPIVPFDLGKALAWFKEQPHRSYGWWDLAQFEGIPLDTSGIVCSPFITEFSRAGGLDPFNGEPAKKIAPFEFLITPVYHVYDFESTGLAHV